MFYGGKSHILNNKMELCKGFGRSLIGQLDDNSRDGAQQGRAGQAFFSM